MYAQTRQLVGRRAKKGGQVLMAENAHVAHSDIALQAVSDAPGPLDGDRLRVEETLRVHGEDLTRRSQGGPSWAAVEEAHTQAPFETLNRLSALWQRESLFDEQGLLRVRGMIAEG